MKIGLIAPMAVVAVTFGLLGCNQDMKRYGIELDRTAIIQGMDLNSNGVRDDLDVYLSKNFSVGAQQNSVMDLILSYQKALVVDKGNTDAVKSVANQYANAMYCLFEVFPDVRLPDGSTLPLIMKSIVVNTAQRKFEYAQYNEVLRGYVAPYPEKLNCK